MSKTILVTGAAGFIGSHLVERLVLRGDTVVGLDNFDTYYTPERKYNNLAEVRDAIGSQRQGNFVFVQGDIRDVELLDKLFQEHRFDVVLHLAALAGVRASIDDPYLYFDVNLMGTVRLLDACVKHKVPHLVMASTSSVYGNTETVPFDEEDPCDRPLAPYAASKRGAEMAGHTYHNIHKLNFTAVRFFTVYGPRNRPDMMCGKVLLSLTQGVEIPVYYTPEGAEEMKRDWTYVGDIVSGLVAAADKPLGFQVINMGRGYPVSLNEFLSKLETVSGRKIVSRLEPMPAADVIRTWAKAEKAQKLLGYAPSTSVDDGVKALWEWYVKSAESARS